VQEALTNILKHAQARQAEVDLRIGPSDVRIQIVDDGKGFDLSTVAARRDGGLGVMGMRERAELLGGRLQVTSGPRGTRVEALIPVGAMDA